MKNKLTNKNVFSKVKATTSYLVFTTVTGNVAIPEMVLAVAPSKTVCHAFASFSLK